MEEGETFNHARLRWQCRRGMRELDELLLGFIDRHLGELAGEELAAFEALLRYPDDLLYECLMGRMVPMEEGIAHVVRKIRCAVGD